MHQITSPPHSHVNSDHNYFVMSVGLCLLNSPTEYLLQYYIKQTHLLKMFFLLNIAAKKKLSFTCDDECMHVKCAEFDSLGAHTGGWFDRLDHKENHL